MTSTLFVLAYAEPLIEGIIENCLIFNLSEWIDPKWAVQKKGAPELTTWTPFIDIILKQTSYVDHNCV